MTRIGSPRPDAPHGADAAQARRDRGETSRDPFRDPRRDGGGQNAAGSHRDFLGRRDPGSDGARSQAKGGSGTREGGRDGLPGFEGSASPFQRLVEERSRDGEGREGSDRHPEEDPAGTILAVAEPRTGVPAFPTVVPEPPSGPAPPAGEAGALPPGEGGRMVALAERVDAALRLDRIAQACGEGTFRLVGEAACGLESVGVALTRTGLDVTLTHGFAAAPEELARSAALLAGQLQERFPTRRVRILQAAARVEADASGPDGLMAIGRWLARPAS